MITCRRIALIAASVLRSTFVASLTATIVAMCLLGCRDDGSDREARDQAPGERVEEPRKRPFDEAVDIIAEHIARARELAIEHHQDFAVEFHFGDNGTCLWIESEDVDIERVPDLWELQHELGGGAVIALFVEKWRASGGTCKYGLTECTCCSCGHCWTYTNGDWRTCPACGKSGPKYPHEHATYYYDFAYHPDEAKHPFGDNAGHGEPVYLPPSVRIAPHASTNFINWDAQSSVQTYGYDGCRDIRIGRNGALVQTHAPVICLRDVYDHRRRIKVIRLTCRLADAD